MRKKESLEKNINLDWVLKGEIAVGPAPRSFTDVSILKKNHIVGILSLCSLDEIDFKENLSDYFKFKRLILPDHKYKNDLTIEQLNQSLNYLEELKELGPVYVHCVAAKERSPLVCMGWLVKKHNLTPTQALDYMMEIHKGTNPLPKQFNLLKLIK